MLQEQDRVTQREAFQSIGSGLRCDRVVLSLARGEIDIKALDAALIVLDAVKDERQRMIDKKFTPESEQAVEQLADTVTALASLGREFKKETIPELQETLSAVKEGKTPSKERLEEARSFFGALGKLYLIHTSSLITR